jgi:hypothetical protein
MVPGLTEREFHALEAIRRDWLDSELSRRTLAPLDYPIPIGSRLRTAAALLARLSGRALTHARSNGPRGSRTSVETAAAKRGAQPIVGRL